MNRVTYYTLAEDYHKWLCHSILAGCNYSGMVGVAQTVLEFLLKQIISDNLCNNTVIMSSHNLRDLANYIQSHYGYDFSCIQLEINTLSNYFYNTRYPGKDSFFASPAEVKQACEMAQRCFMFLSQFCNKTNTTQGELL